MDSFNLALKFTLRWEGNDRYTNDPSVLLCVQ